MKTELLRANHPIAINHAVDILQRGGLVAFPTDTIYGLAALPFQRETVERLFIAKGRNSNRAIAILVGAIEDVGKVARGLDSRTLRLALRFWPGPLTLIVPGMVRLPDVLSPNNTVGLRMPDHPVALSLLRAIGPLAVTSANLSGQENPLSAQDVLSQLNGRIDLILDGGVSPGCVPSTVVDCTQAELVVLREGPISSEALQAASV